jgi:nicotinamidase-related amidase
MPSSAWLVVVDMQAAFQGGPWKVQGMQAIKPRVRELVAAFGARVVFTRFVAPGPGELAGLGAWAAFYEDWPAALQPGDAPLWDLVDGLGRRDEHPVLDTTTFGKWGAGLRQLTGGADALVLAGVATDCCILSTALAAADAGVSVRVASDACAGSTPGRHAAALDLLSGYTPLVQVYHSGL